MASLCAQTWLDLRLVQYYTKSPFIKILKGLFSFCKNLRGGHKAHPDCLFLNFHPDQTIPAAIFHHAVTDNDIHYSNRDVVSS